ncbi:MAG: minichromosome maintenance protein MCM [Candidatus Diapherotrites archaeon]|nr:minichromosome maintenance protein MCM [Candidatus Diapherotrites archaeon]
MPLKLSSTEEVLSEESPLVEKFQNFFETRYRKEIEHLAETYPEKRSLFIDFAELEKFDYSLADELLEKPDTLLEAARLALKRIELPTLDVKDFSVHIRVFNLPEDRKILLRNLSANHINRLICVEGVIKQITDVLPKLKLAVWRCNRCGNVYRVPQSGQTIIQPAMCECRHKDFSLVEEQSKFVDYQKIQIQEPLEVLKGSEQPTTLDIYVSDDLVNKVLPGEKVVLVGVLRLAPAKAAKPVFGRYLECIYLEQTQQEFEEIDITPEEEEKIRELAKDPEIYEKLINSIAPSIYGHEDVKEAIVLQLFGGVKKVLPTQAIRGNIHILLVGDPGTAKSQILMSANAIAPKSIYVGGKTTSGVGLTASAVKDEFGEGSWTLKAGALVLASGGVAMVDELDKMPADERSALHEAMEQGTVSVAKAGIIARFKTDTSILAAANPKFSRFEQYEPLIEQIDLPPTLISRFDLFFMIKDVLDRTRDTEIANFILKTHQAGEKLLQSQLTGKKLKKKEEEQIKAFTQPVIEPDLLRKYISYARQKVFPTLSKEAIETLAEFYVGLRERGKQEGSYAATHRQLEGLIRLSEASARVRLSNVVEKQDAERAIRLLKRSLKDVVTDPETGKIDIDLIISGQTHTQLENMRKLLAIIKEKAKQQDNVAVDDVIAEASQFGLDREKVEDLLNKLERKGEIYRPRYGFVKPTQRD